MSLISILLAILICFYTKGLLKIFSTLKLQYIFKDEEIKKIKINSVIKAQISLLIY